MENVIFYRTWKRDEAESPRYDVVSFVDFLSRRNR